MRIKVGGISAERGPWAEFRSQGRVPEELLRKWEPLKCLVTLSLAYVFFHAHQKHSKPVHPPFPPRKMEMWEVPFARPSLIFLHGFFLMPLKVTYLTSGVMINISFLLRPCPRIQVRQKAGLNIFPDSFPAFLLCWKPPAYNL